MLTVAQLHPSKDRDIDLEHKSRDRRTGVAAGVSDNCHRAGIVSSRMQGLPCSLGQLLTSLPSVGSKESGSSPASFLKDATGLVFERGTKPLSGFDWVAVASLDL